MFGFNRKKIEITPEDQVSLKPVFGIQPGIYLTGLYLIVLLGLLFMLLVYPGLTKRGSYYTIRTEPSGAAIRIDDVYQGTSPCTIFVPQGKRTITAVLPGFTSAESKVNSGNRLFASLLFPIRKQLFVELKTNDPLETVLEGAKAFSAWSFAGEPSATYQVPMVLSEAMYRGAHLAATSGKAEALKGILAASSRFANTSVALRDLSRAIFLAAASGQAPSGLALLSAIQDSLSYLNDNPSSARWLGTVLPSNSAKVLTDSAWYKQAASDPQISLGVLKKESVRLGKKISIGPVQFWEIKGENQIYYMAEREISQKDWDAFVAENPKWAKSNKNSLESQGLVGPDYLETPEDSAFPAGAAPGVSRFAAEAFCKWLDTKVTQGNRQVNGSVFRVRLPTEAEWYIAATQFGNQAFAHINGGLWEWCADPFVPFPDLKAPELYQKSLGSPEYVVKGGSWANKTQSIQPETRASLPPDSSSPFVGFRPVFAIEVLNE
ncbi:SUMF1/EgtB/PvdO family nonheme iron enzyme [Gracilinema caldarium]|uniref:SUMF1/EgtB/PvdO family nonheme iron enzyme n=1 Tax=Gracilinema caldarium TaxID=215591 RepID=UPI0026ECE131|nr:SUMF1/EgtB/PvdO family nonheme iron enzyme [Gracilinema caldarium]